MYRRKGRYLILKAKGAPAQQLIHSLESYTSQEIDEKWLYELAELYTYHFFLALHLLAADALPERNFFHAHLHHS